MARYGDIATPFKEIDIVKPVDPYGVSKVAAENILSILSKTHGIEYNIAVPHNIIGPKQKYNDPFRNVASIMINLILQNRQPIIYGDGNQTRDYIYVKDVVAALVISASKNENLFLNIGTGVETSVNQLVSSMQKEFKSEIEPIFAEARDGELKRSVLSNKLAMEKLNWVPEYTLSQGMQKVFEWLKT